MSRAWIRDSSPDVMWRMLRRVLPWLLWFGLVWNLLLPVALGQERIAIVLMTGQQRSQLAVEVARTDSERALGLMYRTELAPDHGMLFVYPPNDGFHMWMHNTYISLDMIFMDAQGRVLGVVSRTAPLSRRPLPSPAGTRFVLEVNAGVAAALGVRVGQTQLAAAAQLLTP